MNDVWKTLIANTIVPTSYTWLVIAGPAALLLITVVLMRLIARPKPNTRVWMTLGSVWRAVGLILFFGTLIAFILVAIFDGRQQTGYEQRLLKSASSLSSSRDQKVQIRELLDNSGDYFTTGNLKDFGREYIGKLQGNERINFLDAWLIKTGKTIVVADLYFPPKKLAELKRQVQEHGSTMPVTATEGLRYTPEQLKVYKDSEFAKLFGMLNQRQWNYYLERFLEVKKNQLNDIIVSLCDYLPSDKVQEMRRELYKRRFDSGGEKEQPQVTGELLSWLISSSENNSGLFDAFLRYHMFIRQSLWVLFYLLIDLWILIVAAKISRDGRRRLFPVY